MGDYETGKEACQVLWGHFVAQPSPPHTDVYVTEREADFQLTLHRYDKVTSCNNRTVLLSDVC